MFHDGRIKRKQRPLSVPAKTESETFWSALFQLLTPLHLSGIRCLPACEISPICLNSKEFEDVPV